MKLGIVGLPNVGKSTLFNAITKAGAESANYPFCTIEPNIGVVDVPDQRLQVLAQMHHSKKIVPTSCTFLDIAGLVKGASKGEGLGNQFLSHIREVDAIIHVVRCFDDDNIVHVNGTVNPKDDIETINLELILADLEMLTKIHHKIKKNAKGDPSLKDEVLLLEKVLEHLEEGKSIRTLDLSKDQLQLLKNYNLLSYKPTLYVGNVSADSRNQEYLDALASIAEEEGSGFIEISAQIENEIAMLDDDEKSEFLEAMGLEESGLDRLIQASYRLLNLISFLTSGEPETRAWTIKDGTLAPQAAGKIHSDIEKGFIRAEVISYDELKEIGSLQKAKELGKLRLEGKDYLVKDGDVIHFRFNV